MNRSSLTVLLIFAVALVVLGGIFWNKYENLEAQLAAQGAPVAADEEEPELAVFMSQLQYYSQKLILSAEAENAELSDFYLHELEELSEEIQDEVPEYEGYEIGSLVETMLVPTIEQLEEQLDSGDWSAVSGGIDQMVQSCNSCHEATDHGFIEITASVEGNPYNQDFRSRLQP